LAWWPPDHYVDFWECHDTLNPADNQVRVSEVGSIGCGCIGICFNREDWTVSTGVHETPGHAAAACE
jgi:hypothetical protein